jgi:cystathionine beta-lyase
MDLERTPDRSDEEILGIEYDRLRSLTCAKWTWHDPDVLPAWVADMDLPPSPVAVDAVRALVDRGDFGYSFAAQGCLPDTFAEWEARRHGWRPDEKRTRVFCDVMQGVEIGLWLGTKPGDGVVVFTPVYPPFLRAGSAHERHLIECPLHGPEWRLEPEKLADVIEADPTARAILLCNPHNPTGRVFDREELTAIAEIAEQRDLLVISDEIWADLVFPGAKHIPFASLGQGAAERTITLTAASKAFNLAGLRCAIGHLGHEGVRSAMEEIPAHVFGAVGSPGAEAMLAAWTQGEPWLAETVEQLLSQRDHLAFRLAEELPEVGFSAPEATYLAWLDFRELDLAEDPAKWLLENARVALSAGPDFGSLGEGFARLNFATTRPILDAIIDRIVRAIRTRR